MSGTTGLGSLARPLERSLPKASPLTTCTADLAADTYAPSAVCSLTSAPVGVLRRATGRRISNAESQDESAGLREPAMNPPIVSQGGSLRASYGALGRVT